MRRPGFGLALPVFDSHRTGFEPLADVGRRAERLGFDSLWAGDHLFFHSPNIECLVALAAVAGATEDISLGTGVLLPALRDPVVLAKQLLSVDVVSGGRLIAGFGVGGEYEREWEVQGIDVRTRGRRTDEAIELWKRFSTGDPVRHEGRHFHVDAPALSPEPVSDPVPLWIGGRVEAAMRRAVRLGADGWFPGWMTPARVASDRERLAEMAAEAGREPPAVGLLLFVYVGDSESGVREAIAFTEQHYAMPWSVMERYSAVGPAEHVRERLAEYRAAGVEDFILAPLGGDLLDQHEQLGALKS